MNRINLLSGWSLMRWLRLAMGILFAIQAVQFREALAGMVSVFFLVQAITNTGCCGAEGCVAPKSMQKNDEEVSFEEVKLKE